MLRKRQKKINKKKWKFNLLIKGRKVFKINLLFVNGYQRYLQRRTPGIIVVSIIELIINALN